ncbi:hypothetical protein [Stieleria mannarensis]|uniref:hypothetical protein n=1 Tax=Stieleria mannarensis TaxID=2755585 RepID=UPI001603291D|nr:hypothetical protein [Rhodopirellula sp. JC639]
MSKTEQSRQKKLAKKRKKEIAKRKQLAAEKNAMKSIVGQISAAQRAPIMGCYVANGLLDNERSDEIGGVLVGRPLPDGRVVFVCFLVDKACLGVKDAFARLVTPQQFSEQVRGFSSRDPMTKCEPSLAKKLVSESVRWAGQFGLTPMGDYQRVSRIWQDVDETACEQEFRFGRDGVPCYIQGPNDSPEFVHRVMNTIGQHLGDGQVPFLMTDDDVEAMEDWDDEDEDDPGEETRNLRLDQPE